MRHPRTREGRLAVGEVEEVAAEVVAGVSASCSMGLTWTTTTNLSSFHLDLQGEDHAELTTSVILCLPTGTMTPTRKTPPSLPLSSSESGITRTEPVLSGRQWMKRVVCDPSSVSTEENCPLSSECSSVRI